MGQLTVSILEVEEVAIQAEKVYRGLFPGGSEVSKATFVAGFMQAVAMRYVADTMRRVGGFSE